MKNFGELIKRPDGRFGIETGYYWTCGNPIQIWTGDRWLHGTVEHDGVEYYVSIDNGFRFGLYAGLLAQAVD